MGLNPRRRAALTAFLALAGCGVRQLPRAPAELWHAPGNVESFDFMHGAHGPAFMPKPPFRFVREDQRGTSPKVFLNDAEGRLWRVKGGLEVRAESFCTRLVAALGYYAEPTYFLPTGRIDGLQSLSRASGFIQPNGTFTWASFERFEPGLRFLPDNSWNWSGSPFDGTPELNGLKILVMLLSDWDNKDARNSLQGSNLGILERAAPRALIYFVDDWGQSLGRWGDRYSETSTFDCAGFRAQTAQFVLGVKDGLVQFGFHGQHTADFMQGIGTSDVSWLMQWLGRITDNQLRDGLRASGANPTETTCLAASLRDRINQLRAVSQRF